MSIDSDTNSLVNAVLHNLSQLEKGAADKRSFVPMPGGAPPEAAPPQMAMAGPAMDSAVGAPPPAPAAGNPGPPPSPDELQAIIAPIVQQTIQQMGIQPGQGDGEEGDTAKKPSAEERIAALEDGLNQLLTMAGLPPVGQGQPKSAPAPEGQADAMSAGSGAPDAGQGAMPMPGIIGPMDPNAPASLGQTMMNMPAVGKMALDESFLDPSSIADLLRR